MAAMISPSTPLSFCRFNKLSPIKHLKTIVLIPTTPFKSSVTVRATEQQTEQDTAFTSKEDLGYLWKLGTGSVIGSAAIKYGSVIFPAITKPNITEALFIIFVPVFVAVLLLFNQSRVEK